MKFKWVIYVILLITGITLNFSQDIYEQWIKYKLRDETIIIAFSTTPHRISNMQETIQSLFEQKIKPQKIYLSIPYVFKRDNIEYQIPSWLNNENRITILRTQDYGPATKILGVLEQVSLPDNAIIISVDDDIYYPPNFTMHLAYQAQKNPNYAIGTLGAKPDYEPGTKQIAADSVEGLINIKYNNSEASILQGFAGIAYRRHFFDQEIFDIVNAPRECINSDDLYIAYYLAKHNIPRKITNTEYLSYKHILWDQAIGLQGDALHNLIPSPADKHRACVAYMRQRDPEVKF